MSHRDSLLSLLNDYQPLDEKDLIQRNRIIQFVKSESTCFDRSLQKGHLTGSCWLVDPSRKKILLTYHKKLKKWLQLGGHADGENELLQVAIREAKEESGLKNIFPLSEKIFDLDIHLIPERPKEPEHFHYDIRFILEAYDPDKIQKSKESIDLKWVEIHKLEEFTDEKSILRMKKKYLLSC